MIETLVFHQGTEPGLQTNDVPNVLLREDVLFPDTGRVRKFSVKHVRSECME